MYELYNVEKPGRFGRYNGLTLDIISVYQQNGDLSRETYNFIDSLGKEGIDRLEYNPTWYYGRSDIDLSVIDFLQLYLNTFINNPAKMIKAILMRMDCLWDIYPGKDTIVACANYTQTIDGNEGYNGTEAWNDIYPKRVKNPITDVLKNLLDTLYKNQVYNMLVWRSGFSLGVVISVAICMIFHGYFKNVIVIFLPYFGQALGLILSTGWSDYRYFWSLGITGVCVFIISLLYTMIKR